MIKLVKPNSTMAAKKQPPRLKKKEIVEKIKTAGMARSAAGNEMARYYSSFRGVEKNTSCSSKAAGPRPVLGNCNPTVIHPEKKPAPTRVAALSKAPVPRLKAARAKMQASPHMDFDQATALYGLLAQEQRFLTAEARRSVAQLYGSDPKQVHGRLQELAGKLDRLDHCLVAYQEGPLARCGDPKRVSKVLRLRAMVQVSRDEVLSVSSWLVREGGLQ